MSESAGVRAGFDDVAAAVVEAISLLDPELAGKSADRVPEKHTKVHRRLWVMIETEIDLASPENVCGWILRRGRPFRQMMTGLQIGRRLSSGSVFLRNEHFDVESGFDVDLRSPDPDVVTHRRIRQLLPHARRQVSRGFGGPVTLLAWCVDIYGEHGVDRVFERIELW
ncbi:hypothetical protein ABIB34_003781 [Rhodococcus sp. UYP5]